MQGLVSVLKNAIACLAVALLPLAASAIDDSTIWEEVPPTNTVKSVVERFAPQQTETDPTVPAWAKAETPPQTMTTNAVCDIVTNGVVYGYTDWVVYVEDRVFSGSYSVIYQGGTEWLLVINIDGQWEELYTYTPSRESATRLTYGVFTATRQPITRNALGLARLKDLDDRTTAESVTNIVRDLSLGGIWDPSLEVWWTPRMRNGSLTYEATTNVNLNAGN